MNEKELKQQLELKEEIFDLVPDNLINVSLAGRLMVRADLKHMMTLNPAFQIIGRVADEGVCQDMLLAGKPIAYQGPDASKFVDDSRFGWEIGVINQQLEHELVIATAYNVNDSIEDLTIVRSALSNYAPF